MSNFGCFWAINSAKTKNSKIYSDNFFCIPKSYLHANFQENWSKNEGARGGQGSKKHIDLIWKIPSLWCQRFLRNVKILLRSEVIGVSMCWPFDFSIVILGVIFDTFYTSFGYKNWNIETNTSKFCIDVHFNGLFWLKNFDLEIFGWFWQI